MKINLFSVYLSPQYIIEQLLTKVLYTFKWSAPFKLEDEMPFGIVFAFPKSHFLFAESLVGNLSEIFS
tara:strand:+ start:1369 stop:1572 length:204 start_codon:yes stop_codon:yes gene_type:complete